MKKIGTRIEIKSISQLGIKEFAGHKGYIGGIEKDGGITMYRIYFDNPVKVPGLSYKVTDDLFAGIFLKTLKIG